MHSIAGERTPVVIAHQFSTITHAGQVYVLGGGTPAEAGHHGAIDGMVCAVQTGEATNPEVKS